MDASTIAAWIRATDRVVVLCGAGISTDSGIPDFRGPSGLWTRNPGAERLSSLHHYLADSEVRKQAWGARLEHPAWTAKPNAGHLALVELEQKGKLHTLITQNIDGLHQQAGTSPNVLIEIHGTLRDVVCMNCGDRGPMETALERVRSGETDPPCRACGGILKSATISFGQGLIPEDLQRAEQAAITSRVFVSVGSSLTVYPVAYLPMIALESGARLVIFNAEPTPLDDRADAVVRDPIGVALPEIVRLV